MLRLAIVLATFLLTGLALSASAQGVAPSAGERAVVVSAAMLSGVGSVVGTYALIPSWYDTPGGVTLLVLAYPAGMALGTVAAAEALGLDAAPFKTAQDAVLGAAAGALAGGAVGLVVGGTVSLLTGTGDFDLVSPLVGVGVGALTALSVSSVVASRRVEATSAAFVAPTGERAAGIAVRLSL